MDPSEKKKKQHVTPKNGGILDPQVPILDPQVPILDPQVPSLSILKGIPGIESSQASRDSVDAAIFEVSNFMCIHETLIFQFAIYLEPVAPSCQYISGND